VEIAPGVVMTVARPAIMEVRTPADGTATTEGPSGTTGFADGNGDPTDPTR
jgi:preprotein translocase subunit YajC